MRSETSTHVPEWYNSHLTSLQIHWRAIDHIDGDIIEAVFDPPEIDQGLAFRQSIAPDLMALLREWSLGFYPLNTIEQSLSDLIDARGSNTVQRTSMVVTAQDAMGMLEPGDVLIDCTGANSLLRVRHVSGRTHRTARPAAER